MLFTSALVLSKLCEIKKNQQQEAVLKKVHALWYPQGIVLKLEVLLGNCRINVNAAVTEPSP
jgi:hypothetical protein